MDRSLTAPTVYLVTSATAAPRRPRTRRAFTFVEAATTIVVLGVLGAIAGFGGTLLINMNNDASAKHNVAEAAIAAESWYTEWGSWPTAAQMPSAESAYTYVDGSSAPGVSTGSTTLSVGSTNSGATYSIAALSASGKCFIATVAPAQSSTSDVHVTATATNCYATSNATGSSW